MGIKTKKQIEKALKDSKKLYKKEFNNTIVTIDLTNYIKLRQGIRALAIANEICTLNWVLGKGVLNCYGKKKIKRFDKN